MKMHDVLTYLEVEAWLLLSVVLCKKKQEHVVDINHQARSHMTST